MATCYIVGAGDFTARGFAPGPGDLILAADGGYRALYRLGTTPDLLLGDFDSLGDAPLPPGLPVLRFPARKDDTDTGLALRHGLMLGFRDFALYGCAGGRTDHLLANFQSMARVSRLGATIRLAAPDYDAWSLTGPAPCAAAPCAAAAANPCAAPGTCAPASCANPCAAAPCAAAANPCAAAGTCAPPPRAQRPRHPHPPPAPRRHAGERLLPRRLRRGRHPHRSGLSPVGRRPHRRLPPRRQQPPSGRPARDRLGPPRRPPDSPGGLIPHIS